MTALLAALPFFTAGLLTLLWDWCGHAVTHLANSALVTVLVFLVAVGILSALVLVLLEVEVRLDPARPSHRR